MIKFPTIKELDKESHRRQSYISRLYPDFHQYILDAYPKELIWVEKLYWYYHNINTHPLCPICGKPSTFQNFNKGYNEHCSRKCNNNDKKTLHNRKQIFLNKYGVECPTQLKEIQDKAKQTCLKRYGVEHVSQSELIKNKKKQNCLERYGVEYVTQLDNTKEKSKQTCLEKYGVEYPMQSQEIQNKKKQTCLNKYGAEYYNQTKEGKSKLSNILGSEKVRNKVEQTCLERYGVKNVSRSTIIKKKISDTHKSTEYQNKIKQIYLERYGVEHLLQSNEFQNKYKQTCLKKYNAENYAQSEEYQSRHDEIQTKSNNTKRLNHTFSSSQIEELFSDYLDSQNIEYKRQYRSKEYPFNCDFYLPKYDLYIEIQASWTHGGHPFNKEADKYVLETWKSKNTDYYNNAIETWTVRDVKKREIAKLGGLNYLEIFSNNIDETIKTFEKYKNTI